MIDDTGALKLIDLHTPADTFMDDVLDGLRCQPKRLPCKYFYDERGCELFDGICDLDEYYLTRTELSIMRRFSGEMARQLGSDCIVIELGSGSGLKTRLLLDELDSPRTYAPIDIAREYLETSAAELSDRYPELNIVPVRADFTEPFEIPLPADATRVVYFPGSTIGNFEPPEAEDLLTMIGEMVGEDGGLLVGIDLKKDVSTLEAAYNDRVGVTAEFNLNLLHRINRELGADFDVDCFSHRAVYDEDEGRIEMHLVSTAEQDIEVGDEIVSLEEGEAIVTEYSHKYTIEEFRALSEKCGLALERHWSDDERLFAVLFLRAV